MRCARGLEDFEESDTDVIVFSCVRLPAGLVAGPPRFGYDMLPLLFHWHRASRDRAAGLRSFGLYEMSRRIASRPATAAGPSFLTSPLAVLAADRDAGPGAVLVNLMLLCWALLRIRRF